VDATWEYAVRVSASVQASPASIKLWWPQDTQSLPSSYAVYRKSKEATSWGAAIALPGRTTSYTDTNVTAGVAYEYQIVKTTPTYKGYGYIFAAIDAPMVENRGKVLLLVDNAFSAPLADELARLEQDLIGDGWSVLRHDVSRSDSVQKVKALIVADYKADPANVKSLFLFGHVPVPYSGSIIPDGHYPDHQGAWPADAYYGDIDGKWTDSSLSSVIAADPRNRNVPGDGKFDQSSLPSPIELQVGRVDMANLPGRASYKGPATLPSELELLRQYLNKDHSFRHSVLAAERRAVLHDDFGYRGGEAFAASGYRSLSAFFGAENVATVTNRGEWLPALAANSYLWAYGCGPGSYTSIGGLGNTGQYRDVTTTEFVKANPKAIFTMIFGSWLGDWDSEDNIMRATLATPNGGLAAVWSGRPHWFLHHMALGETIGYSTRLTQNNGPHGLYQTQVNSAAGQVHVALMGDPTLRMHVVPPPSAVRAEAGAVSWAPSADNVLGYYVYRAQTLAGPFTRLTPKLIQETAFADPAPSLSEGAYMVRAVKLESTPSGTYFNSSQGAFSPLSPSPMVHAAPATDANPVSPTGRAPEMLSMTPAKGLPLTPKGEREVPAAKPGTPSPAGLAVVTNRPPATGPSTNTTWVDDDLPANAVPGADGGDSWNWVSSNPAPFSGTRASQSALAAGLHQHYFDWATATLAVGVGDHLYAYVYLDPNNLPSELMLQWTDGSWEHRAYWGANKITYGVNGTASRRFVGPLPPAGQWARLDVAASQVGLEGSTVKGMAFSAFDGRATWDFAGLSPAGAVASPPVTNTDTNAFVWIEDALPNGAVPNTDGGDSWTWVNSNPAPFSGALANQSALRTGLHQHYFDQATATMPVSTGDKLFAYIFLDPSTPPSEVMLQWNDGSWEHRAYWGANQISYGRAGTTSRVSMGALPPLGQWTRLEVPASQVALEGRSVRGMAFSLYDGRATWDFAGKSAMPVVIPLTNNPPATNIVAITNPPPSTNIVSVTNPPPSTNIVSVTNTPPGTNIVSNPDSPGLSNLIAWVDDALPAGATESADGGDSWNWVSANPAPFSGTRAHQSSVASGLHQHYFSWASATLPVNTGDSLVTYIYLDPVNPPSEVMLQWTDGSWEHRAYWGANNITYGTDGAASRRYMGALPPAGQWARLTAPASQVGLEGATLKGMSFTLFGGGATWDLAGKATLTSSDTSTNLTDPGTNSVPVVGGGDPSPGVGGGSGTAIDTNTSSGTYVSPNTVSVTDYVTLELPKVGDNALKILSPTLLELKLINSKQPDPAPVTTWNFVDANFQFTAPSLQEFAVTVNGQPATVQAAGFKRRPLYAPLTHRDLRIENCLYLKLANPIADGQQVEVRNQSGSLWPSSMAFSATADALRFSPAIHVNQEGYVPSFSKKAMVGYFAGSLGEMDVSASAGFKLVDAKTGAQVFQGSLVARPDVGFKYTPTPYQKVFVADFTAFTTPGEYRLQVPGLGASLPFLIDDGIAMGFARAYALGLYHQRCGTDNSMPFTRHTHGPCHTGQAEVPSPQSSFPFTWTTVAGKNVDFADYQAAGTPQLKDEASQLFPFVNKGKIDVSGGHHDAGDYSKYTINSAGLIHYLMFAVDSFQGVAALDNLGIPESGDGISDLMQEAKWEADFLAKMQDADGGFYFLVYPRDREYESNVTPDEGDSQVVWPKTTAVTACSVAALAQCASSPTFKKQYPTEAAAYLKKAQLGWQFLMNAIAKYGKDGSYQKITHYGNEFKHDDELAWAACEMYLATGDPTYQQKLIAWFNPSDPATWRWGWWRMWESYGRAIRSYAFAARTGRLQQSQLDATFLGKCVEQISLCAQDHVTRSMDGAYGSSFPLESKAVQAAGWFFSSERAFDITVGYQLDPRPEFLEAILANVNYEGGCNPINVSYITGMGWKRQREIVSQYAWNDRRVLPPSGIPLGNIQTTFSWMDLYKSELGNLCYPSDGGSGPLYPFYDRWADTFNISTEFVHLDQARSLASLAFVASRTSAAGQPWKSVAGKISVPTNGLINTAVTASLTVPGMDLAGARVVWEARDQEPRYGNTFTFTPTNAGAQWVEAEAQWPDGRRVFAVSEGSATNTLPTVTVTATSPNASETGPVAGVFTFTRTGATDSALTINYQFSGTATKWNDYRRPQGDMPEFISIPAGAASATLTIVPVADGVAEPQETVILTISPNAAVYNMGQPKSATVTIVD
jgi:hypothetical protein